MRKINLKLLIILLGPFLFGQEVTGKWRTIDDDTKEPKSVVEVYKKGEQVYGKIINILNSKKENAVCKECSGDLRNRPILGMTILENMKKDGDVYEGGTILNPSTGKIYKCRLKLTENPNILEVRGYVAMFYKTQYWERIQ